ncbi:MAG TPA: class I SAM-dependent DNA methyltransferase [Bacilli bacterium]|nr:class I SAM-dependent DNA methyltransferase [Bacilli bacterium]
MADYAQLEGKIESIIDDLKGICNQSGLGNAGGEERVITTAFLYKFLNDKFMHCLRKFSKDIGLPIKDIFANKNDELDAFYDSYSGYVAFNNEDTIEYLINLSSNDKFYELFDNALERISNNPRNSNFNIETSDGTRKPLFEGISKEVEQSAKNNFVRSVFSAISKQALDFSGVFDENFDFYSKIFEYLIKDYNVASGKYAEYFTPQAVSKIIAKILVGMSDKVTASEIYDPSAGSGSLILHLANELGKDGDYGRAIVYTQDISQKSSRFLRINLLLNGLTESLNHAIQGDTLLKPAHFKVDSEDTSGLKQFDYVVANPPFKLDFSSTRDSIDSTWSNITNEDGLKRFFAGVPKIPNKKKESMPIYLLFIQHIIYSMKPNGKAAVVVPTGFITAQSGIEYAIRKYVTDKKMLKGVISMPSNIFANTGTNVSVLFFDKTNTSDEVILIDASKLGTKVKEGKNQRTVLSEEENNKIIDTFIKKEAIEDFSILVKNEAIQEKNYSWSAGQYFEVKIEYVDITQEEYEKMIDDFNKDFEEYANETTKFQKEIKEVLEGLKIHDK